MLGSMLGSRKFGRFVIGPWLMAATYAMAQPPSSFQETATQPPAQVKASEFAGIGIDQRLNQQVPLDLQFKDENGQTVKLGDYFKSGRPVVLSLVYYTCPMLCDQELAGESSALSTLKFTPGKQYEILSVSFNPNETPQDAAEKKKVYIARLNEHLNPKSDGSGWHFLTGQQPEIKQLADAVGFHYRYDPATRQYIHATGLMILTPAGKIAQYYYGVEFAPRDLRLGLVQASQDKIGTVVDEVLLYCCRYDATTGRYDAVVARIMSLAGAATLLLVGGFLMVMFRRDRTGSPTRAARVGVEDRKKEP